MLGYFMSGFLRLLLRVWTFGLFYFLHNRLFLWIKEMATPRLMYKKIPSSCDERDQYYKMDSRLCVLNTSQNPWNILFLSNLSRAKKFPYIWLAKTVTMPATSTKLSFLPNGYEYDCDSQEYWDLNSVSEAAVMRDKNLGTDAIFESNCSIIPSELRPSLFETKKENMGLLGQCVLKDFYHDLLQKEQGKMELFKQDDSSAVCEKHCSSAASIDSGYQSFPSVESAYTCIEEEGVTLYVSDCRYDKEGKLICMTVGFGITEDSTTSSDSLVFDNGLSYESDSDCESSDESDEDFIVFDADSSCEEADMCSFDGFVFEGTADEVSVAMSMNACCHPTLEIRITQTVPDPHFCTCGKNDFDVAQEQENFQDKKEGEIKIKTNKTSNSAGAVHKKKKVQFKEQDQTEIHEIIAWDFAYRQARIGHWKNYATDRLQFQRRIDQIAKVIEPVLEKKLVQMNS